MVKSAVELPMLPELSADTGPIDLQDWLTMVGPVMADLSDTSQEWWELMLRHTKKWYDKYMTEPPLQRLLLTPTENNKDLNFKISLARSTLQVDTVPSYSTISTYCEHLLSELEQLVHTEKTWIWRRKRRRIPCSKKGRRGTREKALPVLPHGCRMQKRSAMYLCPRREG